MQDLVVLFSLVFKNVAVKTFPNLSGELLSKCASFPKEFLSTHMIETVNLSSRSVKSLSFTDGSCPSEAFPKGQRMHL